LAHKSQCPECAKNGRDTSKDNLVTYQDGHQYCYGCGYYRPAIGFEKIRKMAQPMSVDKTFDFPTDYTTNICEAGLVWLRKYNLSDFEIEYNNIGYSPSKHMLVFPVFDENRNLLMWQGRNLDLSKKPKYVTYGSPKNTLHIIGIPTNRKRIILTEDLISAIKIGRMFTTMPLWGSHLSLEQARRLARRFDTVGLWLDPDKKKEAVETALRLSTTVPIFVIFSECDPKEYNTDIAAELVAHAAKETIYRDLIFEQPEQSKIYDNVSQKEIQGPVNENYSG